MDTMRVMGKIHENKVIVLIDSGSTHNFISQRVVDLLKIPVEKGSSKVKVASGQSVFTQGRCIMLPLQMQSQIFSEYLQVLGLEWLKTLGSISWNFANKVCLLSGKSQWSIFKDYMMIRQLLYQERNFIK